MRYNRGKFRYDHGYVYRIVLGVIPIKLFYVGLGFKTGISMVNWMARDPKTWPPKK